MIVITKRKPASPATLRTLAAILTELLNSPNPAESEVSDEQTRCDLRPRERE